MDRHCSATMSMSQKDAHTRDEEIMSGSGSGGLSPALDPPYLSNARPLEDNFSDMSLKRFGDNWATMNADAESVSSCSSVRRKKEYSLFTRCVAEFLGDLTFVFIGTMQGYDRQTTMDGTVHAALAHGFTIFIIVATMGHISGGHFNPAVTWAITASGKAKLLELPFYWFAQLLGGFCGSLLACSILTYDEMVNVQAGATLMYVASGVKVDENSWWQGFISETTVTYFLCHTILLTAVDTDSNLLAPLAIGFTLCIDILATGSITGASMNPARSFGPNCVAAMLIEKSKQSPILWSHHYIYWAGPLLGGTIAALIYRLFEGRENRLVR